MPSQFPPLVLRVFAEYAPLVGLSEKVDEWNQDRSDIAFVFSDVFDFMPSW